MTKHGAFVLVGVLVIAYMAGVTARYAQSIAQLHRANAELIEQIKEYRTESCLRDAQVLEMATAEARLRARMWGAWYEYTLPENKRWAELHGYEYHHMDRDIGRVAWVGNEMVHRFGMRVEDAVEHMRAESRK